jgi:hypothetical protein
MKLASIWPVIIWLTTNEPIIKVILAIEISKNNRDLTIKQL